jgi:NAD(P)-dependent dehydrogenase (short-subunit alcohol dehydrogenase family)
VEGAVGIVTGSAAGIGAACAEALAARGARVVVNYSRSEDEAREVQGACEAKGAETLLVQADVAVDDDCRHLAKETLERFGRIDYLVNNAGVTAFADHADLDALDASDFQRIYGVNVIGSFQMTRAVVGAMQEQKAGAIVNVSSIAGVMGIGSSIAYAASKGALNTMTLSLARALAPTIRVNAVCPGFVETRWWRNRLGDAYEDMRNRFAETTPLKTVVSPEEVADLVLWFLESEKVTGETLIIDSGLHLGAAPLVAR